MKHKRLKEKGKKEKLRWHKLISHKTYFVRLCTVPSLASGANMLGRAILILVA